MMVPVYNISSGLLFYKKAHYNKMVRTLLTACLFLVASQQLVAQTALPVVARPAAGSQQPLVLYITGDGGMKQFSTKVVTAFQDHNYPVVALNALKYFWTRKAPEKAAADITALIRQYQTQWHLGPEVILVGYSMGADVMPFVYNALPEEMKAKVQQLVLLSPSQFTDMEIHLSSMMGMSGNKGMSVAEALNRIIHTPLLLIFGEQEKDFSLAALTIRGYKHLVLPGGHTYGDDAAGVVGKIVEILSGKHE